MRLFLSDEEQYLLDVMDLTLKAQRKRDLLEHGWSYYPAPCPRCGSTSVAIDRGPKGAYCAACAYQMDPHPKEDGNLPWPEGDR